MIELDYAEVTWFLNGYCKFQCSYCPSLSKNGGLDFSVDQYLAVIEKLQNTRYQHHSKIYWKLGGGEPLHYPHLNSLLKKIKERPSIVRLDTSGDDSWFSLYSILNYIDRVKLTYHPWQNDDVFGFALEQCQERNIGISIVVPLTPGKINEARQQVQHYKDLGYVCSEQILYEEDGRLYQGYSQVDENRIYGRPDDYISVPVIPAYIDLSVPNQVDPVYTGKPCYAGVDWMTINPRGFVSYSQCGGRNEHYNVFDPQWQPPNGYFACTVNQCRSEQDRRKIRIVSE